MFFFLVHLNDRNYWNKSEVNTLDHSRINTSTTWPVHDWFLYDNGLRHERVKQDESKKLYAIL